MSAAPLYTDLSGYYDLMCADIDYHAQSRCIDRLHRIFGNGGRNHLDLACGTGPHIRHFLDLGYQCAGLDINQPMLDRAQARCPEASFSVDDMSQFSVAAPLDLITCFLYSIHYNDGIAKLKACIASAYHALADNGVFCFNAVDKSKIDNRSSMRHCADFEGSQFTFESGWHYGGEGEKQALRLHIEKRDGEQAEIWSDQHAMVAVDFIQLKALLEPWFDTHIFEHDYQKLLPWDQHSGNAIFVCVKRDLSAQAPDEQLGQVA